MLKICKVLLKNPQNCRILWSANQKISFKHRLNLWSVKLHNVTFNFPKLSDSYYYKFNKHPSLIFAISILTWLGFAKDDEEKESELIMTLKRAVLCKQREQYDKAEQMLHLALRLAQQQMNDQGILYCYDLMGNLAFDTYELDKAEKLFVSVLQLLLSKGTPEDDLKVIHISLKLARICQLKADTEKADIGYRWCLEQIDKHKDANENAKVLYGVINDWYAQYLLDIGDTKKALNHLNEAHKVCQEFHGENSEKSMLLLNDLGITSFRAEDYDKAETYLQEAVTMGNKLEDKTHLGVVHANLGLILLQKGILKEAEKCCRLGWKLGKKYENTESVEQSNYCLEQIKLHAEK
ncbi:tetratricopeptide repeat protein 19 homolog, mitochondrial [Sitophilus oryzae]|uniref:Tetratricopeptide repeat protein 19 homolog, mitochondrial n=1 Tax=Sitophilus oryzae TaxID=7048 RepID=A0A6J2X6N4_SITOR|nr:tetratricopeptide repeat protein 19 homolog, mitochondrial [Sitophilus oryzae]